VKVWCEEIGIDDRRRRVFGDGSEHRITNAALKIIDNRDAMPVVK
jgi:hypothetical protein